jgi:hypothetical protein
MSSEIEGQGGSRQSGTPFFLISGNSAELSPRIISFNDFPFVIE